MASVQSNHPGFSLNTSFCGGHGRGEQVGKFRVSGSSDARALKSAAGAVRLVIRNRARNATAIPPPLH
jgi:hypothetical protein